jgi:exopolysaccharide biosynthesis polyprenyl glycosylphosphotransferase
MHKRNATANFDVAQIFIDLLLIVIGYVASNIIYFQIRHFAPGLNYIWMYIVFSTIFVMGMLLMRMYNITTFYYIDRIVSRSLLSAGFAGLSVAAVIFMAKLETASRLFFLIFAVLSCLITIVGRVLKRWLKKSHVGNGYTHIIFIGDDASLAQYEHYLEQTAMKVKVDCHLKFDSQVLQSAVQFEKLIVNTTVDEVLLVYGVEGRPKIDIPMLMAVCEDMGLTIRLLLDLYELPNSKRFVSSMGTYPMLTYHSTSFDKVQLFFKAAMDVIGAIAGLVIFSPVFLITAIAIKLESPGPVMFKQVRVGQNGKHFKIYKFRSMYQDAEARKKDLQGQNEIKGGLMFKMENDPRITKVGRFIRKTSIDELPQLLNVLKRDMSLVGTRPPTTDEVDRYERYHRRRISIMPGITGMWQTCGRSDINDFEEVVRLDKQYIDEWSLALDIKLLFKTVSAVVMRRGAH